MKKIVLVNTKGGSGKSTLAVTLAGYYASHGRSVTLMDYDEQGSSTRWATVRPEERPPVNLIKAYDASRQVTRSFALRIPRGTERLVVDSPARVSRDMLVEITRDANAIIVPVLPSEIDIHAASRCIEALLLGARIRPAEGRIAVIANRSRVNTRAYAALRRFLLSLDIPFLTTLRDTQNYVTAVSEGLSLHEMTPSRIRADVAQWQPLLDWIETRTDMLANVSSISGRAR